MQIDSQAKLILGALGVAASLLGTLQVVTLNFSFQSYKLAAKALTASKEARPFPYTSIDAEKDEDQHKAEHAEHGKLHAAQVAQTLEFIKTFIALKQSELNRRIDNLPRPPQEFLATYEKRHERIESMLHELRERLGRLEVKLGHKHGNGNP